MADSTVKAEFYADTEGWMRNVQRMLTKQQAVIDKLKATGRAGREAKGGVEGMSSSLSTYAGRFIGVTAAIGAVTQGFRVAGREMEETRNLLHQIATAQLGLSTVAETPLMARQMDYLANMVAKIGGMPAPYAIDFASDLQQVGATYEEILQLSRLGLMSTDPLGIAKTPFKLMTAFDVQNRNLEGMVGGIIAAARVSEVKPETFTPELMSFAGAMEGMNTSWQQAAAALSVGTKAVKNVENAATYLRAYATVLRKDPELRELGMNLVDSTRYIMANWSEDQIRALEDIEVRSLEGFNITRRNLEEIGRVESRILRDEAASQTPGPQNLIDQAIASAGSSPLSRAVQLQRTSEAALQQARLNAFGTSAAVGAAAGSRVQQQLIEEGHGPWASWLFSAPSRLAGWMGADQKAIDLAFMGHGAANIGALVPPAERGRRGDALEDKLTELVEISIEGNKVAEKALKDVKDAIESIPREPLVRTEAGE